MTTKNLAAILNAQPDKTETSQIINNEELFSRLVYLANQPEERGSDAAKSFISTNAQEIVVKLAADPYMDPTEKQTYLQAGQNPDIIPLLTNPKKLADVQAQRINKQGFERQATNRSGTLTERMKNVFGIHYSPSSPTTPKSRAPEQKGRQ
ncbi:MAG: hypothetical protein SFT68_04745 [Rickettsiaceae bacterium]|nr:hypothetical protein [Rickettsiaceae bacterium]